jgi:hypothetical protein
MRPLKFANRTQFVIREFDIFDTILTAGWFGTGITPSINRAVFISSGRHVMTFIIPRF